MTIIVTRYFSAGSSPSEGGIANIYGPFADDDTATAWAIENIDRRTVWATESVIAPF